MTKAFEHTTRSACKLTIPNVIPFESQELADGSLDDSDDNAINMLFMLHENIILKDGKGITQEVSYLGPQFSDEILQHKH